MGAGDEQRGDRAVSPQFKPLTDPGDGAQQAHRVRKLIGHRVDGLVAAAVQEEFLDPAAGLPHIPSW